MWNSHDYICRKGVDIMKNQYVGDIGDYGKYSLLRAFAEEGVIIGVNWYLTPDDGSNDGRFTDYLDKEDLRYLCPEVFDVLHGIIKKKKKTVRDVSKSGIIRNALFFDKMINVSGNPAERKENRKKWFIESMDALSDTELVFMDPDNGLLESNDASKQGADKYVLPDEVKQVYESGKNVVYYCHKGRRKIDAWYDYKSFMFERIPSAKSAVLTYHKGTQRSYIFLIHDDSFVRYRRIIEGFMRKWYRVFSEETTIMGNPADETVGEQLSFEKSEGSVITISRRADSSIQICNSKTPGDSMILDADVFARLLGV